MGSIFYRIGTQFQPAPGSRIVRAKDYASMLEAQSLIDDAKKQAEQIVQHAEEVYAERHKQGYEDGVKEGQMQQSEKMLETSMQAVEYLEGLERQLVDVVSTAVRKIVGEMDEKDRIVRIVRTALDQVRGRERVVIRISMEDEPAVHEALAPMLANKSASSGYELVTDHRMKPGNCILESEMGVLDASLEVQLKAIENALAVRIGEDKN